MLSKSIFKDTVSETHSFFHENRFEVTITNNVLIGPPAATRDPEQELSNFKKRTLQISHIKQNLNPNFAKPYFINSSGVMFKSREQIVKEDEIFKNAIDKGIFNRRLGF